MNSIVITGAAALTRFGGTDASWEAARTGASGGRRRDGFPVVDIEDSLLHGDPAQDRAARMAVQAAREAALQAGLSPGPDRRRAALIGSARSTEHSRLAAAGLSAIPRELSTRTMLAGPAFAVASALGAAGQVSLVSATCASSTVAVIQAMALLRSGQADCVAAGGAEACLTAPYLKQAAALGILTPSVCRPFDMDRDGTWLGEGAAILILEREESARSRGAAPLARILGAGTAYDGAPLANDLSGAALEAAAREALAGIEVDAVVAHAAGTRKGDAIEAGVLGRVLPHRPPMTSLKGTFGHSLGASGAIELVMAVRALRDGIVPATANLRKPDPGFPLPVPREPEPRPIRTLLKTASAMGGLHAAIVLGT